MKTVDKKTICAEIKKQTGFPKTKIRKVVDLFLYEINHALLRGDRVEIRCWAVLEAVYRRISTARNVVTGQKIAPFMQRKIKFKESRKLKEILNQKKEGGKNEHSETTVVRGESENKNIEGSGHLSECGESNIRPEGS